MHIAPWYYQFFLVMIIILSSVLLNKQYDLKPKNKNLVLLTDLLIYFLYGVATSCVILNGEMTWYCILIHIFLGILFCIVFAVFINRTKEIYAEGEQYTAENIIGKKGKITEVISGSFANGFKCLGELYDDKRSNILIHLLPTDTIDDGDEFTIVEIDGDKIIAKKTE